MIDALRLTAGWAAAWMFGIGAVVAATRDVGQRRPGEIAWVIGCGFFAGAFLVTVWMRAVSLSGVPFSLASVVAPVALATLALGVFGWQRYRAWTASCSESPAAAAAPRAPTMESKSSVRSPRAAEASSSRSARAMLYVLVAWLGFRFVVLLLDVIWTPLYPWDAWIQWATKARVWYSLGHIVPFGRTDAWFAANGAIWFDASPNYPATVPLWQVWSSLALGRWDDALMNVPWWLTAVALAVAVYGALRASGIGALGATAGAWLVSSLPLANVHVALAGYADLPMAAYVTVAALATWRWSRQRTLSNAAIALLFAAACATIKIPGLVWALTLVPGVVLASMPRSGPRVVAIGLAGTLLALAVLAQTSPVVLGYRLHLDFAPAWQALVDSLFLLGNWNLLWYAVVAGAIVARSELRTPALVSLSATVGAGALFLVVAFSFTNARNWVTDQTTVNRALLHLAPLALVWTILILHAWFVRTRTSGIDTGPAPAPAPSDPFHVLPEAEPRPDA